MRFIYNTFLILTLSAFLFSCGKSACDCKKESEELMKDMMTSAMSGDESKMKDFEEKVKELEEDCKDYIITFEKKDWLRK